MWAELPLGCGRLGLESGHRTALGITIRSEVGVLVYKIHKWARHLLGSLAEASNDRTSYNGTGAEFTGDWAASSM